MTFSQPPYTHTPTHPTHTLTHPSIHSAPGARDQQRRSPAPCAETHLSRACNALAFPSSTERARPWCYWSLAQAGKLSGAACVLVPHLEVSAVQTFPSHSRVGRRSTRAVCLPPPWFVLLAVGRWARRGAGSFRGQQPSSPPHPVRATCPPASLAAAPRPAQVPAVSVLSPGTG